MSHVETHHGIRHRISRELKQYAIVSAYLYVCLGAFQLYKGALLRAEGISYLPYGIAAVKALILGKFMLVGHALNLAGHHAERPLIIPILHKSLVFLVLLFCLNMLEEVIVGLVHGRTVAAVVNEVTGGTLLQTVAMCVLFFLILLPYFAWREVEAALGERRLWWLMFRGKDGSG